LPEKIIVHYITIKNPKNIKKYISAWTVGYHCWLHSLYMYFIFF